MKGQFTETLAKGLFKSGVRPLVVIVCLLLTAFFGYASWQRLTVNTDLAKMIPVGHPYIQNFLNHQKDMSMGNNLRIVVEDTKHDSVFNQQYMLALKQIDDDVFAMQGVDPSSIMSLWSPKVRWFEIGLDRYGNSAFWAKQVVPSGYENAKQPALTELNDKLRHNILHSGQVGRLISDDFRSSVVKVDLLGSLTSDQEIDIPALNKQLNQLREHYQSKYPFIKIHIVGFAKQMGDIMAAAEEVADFFFLTMLVTLLLLLWDTRCLRSSLVVVVGSFISVIWQLGIVSLLGFTIDPYSMLVPFLVFAISVSHGVQIINSMVSFAADGQSALRASRSAFTHLFRPGLTALLCDAIGFATLWIIPIEAIRELALAASIGVAVIIITKLTFVPVLMSYLGCSKRACIKNRQRRESKRPMAKMLAAFTRPKWAMISVLIAVLGYGVGIWYSQQLEIGDTTSGAPALWTGPCVEANNCARGHEPADKYRYNYDLHYLASHYGVSADVLVVMAVTPAQSCNSYGAVSQISQLGWMLQGVPGVQNVQSIATATKQISMAMNEGNPKWRTVPKSQSALNGSTRNMPKALFNEACDLDRVFVFLDDHKADTLNRVTHAVSEFAKTHNDPNVVKFELAAGNAGIAAAVNQNVKQSQHVMLWLVYAVVILLCLIAFRSWRAMLCIVIPLGLTSILCEALMVWMNMGVKVATLPVIALGVGIGVDYGIYIFDQLRHYLDRGMNLENAYYETMRTTGKAVTFTGLTLAVGVIFWMFSSIKFQADMGLLLTFMFLWNMVGALWLLPALARFLLKKEDVEGKQSR